jgi:hypothetical protein
VTRAASVRTSWLVVLVVTGASLVLSGCSSSAAPGQSKPAPSLTAQLPSGWRTHVYGKAALSVPASWVVVLDASCPPSAKYGTLFLGGLRYPGISCPAALGSGPAITVTHLGLTGPGSQPTSPNCNPHTVNHLRVFVGPCATADIVNGGLTIWTIPTFGIQVSAVTNDDVYTGARTDTLVGKVLHTIRRTSPTEVATRSPLNVRIAFDRIKAKAGTSIKAEAAFTNTTTEAITVETCAADGWLDVGLTGHGIVFAPAHIQIACLPTVQLPPGTTKYPVTVSTSYAGCAQPGESISSQMIPDCLPSGPPPLPVGTYRTEVVTTGLPTDMSGPNVLTVTLTR